MPITLACNFNINLKDNYNAELVKIPSNLTFFRIFLKERLDLILESIWSLDEMWTIYPAWTTFRTLAITDLSWAELINKLLNSLTELQIERFG
jgi:hypothetical protein